MGDGWGRWWGPVFEAERATRARRWQGYAGRSVFVAALLGALGLGFSEASSHGGPVTVQELAEVGETAYSILASLELMAVLLIAPAAAAGAICVDKARGSLAHVFVTDLSDREIVLGKLAARLVPTWSLLACALPVAAAATWLGGIDPMALLGTTLIVAGLAVLGCALALMLSVWASKPQEVLSVVFAAWAVWLLAAPSWQLFRRTMRSAIWLERTNPFYLATAPYDYPGETSLLEPALFALACGLLGATFAAVATWQVRVVGCRSERARARRVGPIGRLLARARGEVRWGKGPPLDRNPVLWREWHRGRPSRWSRWVWVGYDAVALLGGGGLVAAGLAGWPVLTNGEVPILALLLLVGFGLLLVSTATAAVLAEERARGSLDVLISTPVSTRSILVGKWRGAFRMVPRLAVGPALICLAVALADGGQMGLVRLAILYLVPVAVLAQGAALVSLGLALATWIKRTGAATAWTVAVYLVASVGWPVLGVFLRFDRLQVVNGKAVLIIQDQFLSAVLDILLAMGSPAFAAAIALASALQVGGGSSERAAGALAVLVGWTVAYALLAWSLFELTARTFDRCLGRMPERPVRPRARPRPSKASKAGVGELLEGEVDRLAVPG